MKIVTPPAISNLEELLDVAMHPEKLTTALSKMAEMRTAIVEHLDIYTTKQKADEYLSQAQAKQAEAQRLMDEAQTKTSKFDEVIHARLDQLARDQDAWTKAKDQEQAALKARKDEVTAQESALREKVGDLNGLAITLQQRDAELTRLSTKLTAELDKMEQRKALLNAV